MSFRLLLIRCRLYLLYCNYYLRHFPFMNGWRFIYCRLGMLFGKPIFYKLCTAMRTIVIIIGYERIEVSAFH